MGKEQALCGFKHVLCTRRAKGSRFTDEKTPEEEPTGHPVEEEAKLESERDVEDVKDDEEERERDIYDDYSIVKELGHGAYSRVYKGVQKKSGKLVAIKVMAIDKYDDEMKEIIENEIRIMKLVKKKKVQPDGIVQIEDVVRENGRVCIVMEFLDGGELFDRIVKKKHYSEKDAARILSTVAESVHALHSQGIIHRDLKPENLVFSEPGEDSPLKVMDFGLSLIQGQKDPHVSVDYVGSPGYAAPEVLLHRRYSPSNDVWSLGVLLFILLVGRPPFRGRTSEEQTQNVVRGNLQMTGKTWDQVSDSAKDLVRCMLDTDPETRISLQQVLEHEFIVENRLRQDSKHLGRALGDLKRTREEMRLQDAAERAMERATFDLRGQLMNLLQKSTADATGLSVADLTRIIDALQGVRDERYIDLERFKELLTDLGFGYLPMEEMFEILARQSSSGSDSRTKLRETSKSQQSSDRLVVEVDELVVGLSVMAARESRDRIIEYLFRFLSEGQGDTKSLSMHSLGKILRVIASYETPQDNAQRRRHIAYSLVAIFGVTDAASSQDRPVTFEGFKQAIIEFGDDVLQDFIFSPVRSIAETVYSLDRGIITKRPTFARFTSYLSRMASYSKQVNAAYHRTIHKPPRRNPSSKHSNTPNAQLNNSN